MTNAELLGSKLYELRKSHGISQEELADQLKVSRQAISKWERGDALPDTDNLISISKLYGVSLDELVGNTVSCEEQDLPTTQPTNSIVEVQVQSDDVTTVVESDSQNNAPQAEPTTSRKKSKFARILYALPYPILVSIAFILWGCLAPDNTGWQVGWTLYLTVPVYYSIVDCIRKRKLSEFSYPAFCTFVFCLCGMMWNLWHPLWVVFATVPIFYSIASAVDRK